MIDQGMIVIGCSRSADKVAEMRACWPAPHRFDVIDVAEDSDVERWATAVVAERPAPDVIVNNAAIGQTKPAPLWKHTAEDFRRVLATNVEGQANVIRHFLPAMLRRRKGVIVNFSSGWGREVAAMQSLYCASKWAVEGMTRAFALELLPGMAAVTLHPGIINTPGLQGAFGQDAAQYPTPEQWAAIAVPYILQIRPSDNGKPLEVPGMPGYKTPASLKGFVREGAPTASRAGG
ncbi:MAG: SDR family NAD(P)-dependent oxidoreductase [Planctomycetes bacterium]|nr:SDR family NAD(P)-dependent oxidoreductase [Planctomycetota bacterium]